MLLIIQNGTIEISINKYLDYEYRVVKSFDTDVSNIDPTEYDAIIILGGHQSVTMLSSYPYLINVVELIKKCIDKNIPTLGICLGCQLIAYAIGCDIKSCDKLNIDYDTSIMGFDNIFRCHIDYTVPNDKIKVLEYVDNMPYLFVHNKCIYGIQSHPDISPESVVKFSNCPDTIAYAKKHSESIDKNNRIVINKLLEIMLN